MSGPLERQKTSPVYSIFFLCCSDHKPVSMSMRTQRFGEKLALEKDLPAFSPVVHFIDPMDHPWYVAEDGVFSYMIDQNGGRLLDSWDWIGLYHVSSTVNIVSFNQTLHAFSINKGQLKCLSTGVIPYLAQLIVTLSVL